MSSFLEEALPKDSQRFWIFQSLFEFSIAEPHIEVF